MSISRNQFISRDFLKSVWASDYTAFKGSDEEEALRTRLTAWADRDILGETSSEAAFISTFFEELWDYSHAGRSDENAHYHLYPQYAVKGAGQRGGVGKADLAIGLFGADEASGIPQILAEFKDIKSNLDAYQSRKGNTRSPVKQALDYLSEARRAIYLTQSLIPTWAIVTDMNEFRLYWYDRCIFIFFCEDMGKALNYPPQLLRNLLINDSRDAFYEPDGTDIWLRLKRLFKAMNEGKDFAKYKMNQFNGGLFADDPELDGLNIPNHIFCHPGQGENEQSLYAHKQTLLYLSAAYNYASEGLGADQHGEYLPGDKAKADPSKSLGLYTLGRIFEQSITELEILEAKADGQLSVNEESKRKRDGVFYTPEWVVEKIVHHTVSPLLTKLKEEAGWPQKEGQYPDQEAIEHYRKVLREVKILDPACGSGAFLITSLRYLVTEWHALRGLEEAAAQAELEKARSSKKGVTTARRRLRDTQNVRDDATLINDILKKNIYGVDINPASVEISRLALWLHTARGDKPLSSLEDTIKTGNSLISPDFYQGRMDLDRYDEEQRERVNAFDWHTEFADAFDNGGFDAIVGNPPYVKLQNFRKVHADMAEYLRSRADGSIAYESTQNGNFDLYLPFIEQGLRLLNDHGRMGYICPSVWEMNEYGAGLRRLIERGQNLEGWINFRAYQIFAEATTYCALQFFTKAENDAVKVVMASNGEVAEDPFADQACALPYAQIAFGPRWLLLNGPERDLIDRLNAKCKRLDHPDNTTGIFVGIQTSADKIYHLSKSGPNRYLCTPGGAVDPYEVEIEDAIMHPLVSGEHAKRYAKPGTDIYILFPYERSDDGMQLMSQRTVESRYPKAWAHLQSFESELRHRESGKHDDDSWYRFGRNQNIDKQEIPKLIVPRLVLDLHTAVDLHGEFFLDNVDVGGISVPLDQPIFFIAALINSPVCNFAFQRISKPFRGDYLSANKQFIAPLPIPDATPEQKASVAAQAEALQEITTKRRDLANRIAKRTASLKIKKHSINWLFPDLPSLDDLIAVAPQNQSKRDQKIWAETKLDAAIEAKYEALSAHITPSATLFAQFDDGELCFFIDHLPAISGLWMDAVDGEFIAAQWANLAATFNITEKTNGKKLCDALLKIGETDNRALRQQIISLQNELATLDKEIATKEQAINAEIYALYDLGADDIALIEKDRL